MKSQSHHLPRRLLLLLIVLAAWPSLRTPCQEPARPQSARSVETRKTLSYAFVSPNTREDLTLPAAVEALNSPDEQRLLDEERLVACRLRLNARVQKALGSWTDGAENSTLVRLTADLVSLRYASAVLGKFARQKMVLYFRPGSGHARMYVLRLPGRNMELATLAAELDRDGIANRTLVRQRRQLTIYIVDLENGLRAKVQTAMRYLQARLFTLRGDGAFIGDGNDREKAQAIFEEEITKYQNSHRPLRRDCRPQTPIAIRQTH